MKINVTGEIIDTVAWRTSYWLEMFFLVSFLLCVVLTNTRMIQISRLPQLLLVRPCALLDVSYPCFSSIRFDDSAWTPQKLPVCFLYLVDALEDHARKGNLPHFFVPECNLFSTPSFPRKTLAFLVNALGEQKREGLPLLKPPAPSPPLRPTMAAAETSSGKPTENSFQLIPAHYVIPVVVLIAFIVFFILSVSIK